MMPLRCKPRGGARPSRRAVYREGRREERPDDGHGHLVFSVITQGCVGIVIAGSFACAWIRRFPLCKLMIARFHRQGLFSMILGPGFRLILVELPAKPSRGLG